MPPWTNRVLFRSQMCQGGPNVRAAGAALRGAIVARYKRFYPKDTYEDLEAMSLEELTIEAEFWRWDFDEKTSRDEMIDTITGFRSDQEEKLDSLRSETRRELIEWADACGYPIRRSATKEDLVCGNWSATCSDGSISAQTSS